MIAIMPLSLIAHLNELPWRELQLTAGERLFSRGDPVAALYWVTSGGVLLIRHHGNGAALVLQRAGAGDVVAEASLFATAYHCDAEAASGHVPVAVRSLSRPVVLRHLDEAPEFASALAGHLARATQTARLRAEVLTLRTVAARLDAWLAIHDGSLPERGQWKSLAYELGLSPEALYRELARRRVGDGAAGANRHPD